MSHRHKEDGRFLDKSLATLAGLGWPIVISSDILYYLGLAVFSDDPRQSHQIIKEIGITIGASAVIGIAISLAYYLAYQLAEYQAGHIDKPLMNMLVMTCIYILSALITGWQTYEDRKKSEQSLAVRSDVDKANQLEPSIRMRRILNVSAIASFLLIAIQQ